MIRSVILILAVLALFLFPWPFALILGILAAFLVPVSALVLGIMADALYAPGALPAWGALLGVLGFLGALFVRYFVRTRIMS